MLGARERLIIGIVAAIVVVGLVWVAVVSPERSTANGLSGQIVAEQQTLAQDQSQLALAEQSRTSYKSAVHAIAVLNTAVPLSDEVPALIRLVNALEAGHSVSWSTTSLSSASTADFPAINLTFSFRAGYVNLQHFIAAIDSLTSTDGLNVAARGRLVTVNSLGLSPVGGGATAASVTMTVYQEGLGDGATGASGPTDATATTAAAG